MSANMYRVGDYVYFEISSSAPLQIRRIEELNKTQSGNVEAKVMCFYRRRDISPVLLKIADQHQGTEATQRKEGSPESPTESQGPKKGQEDCPESTSSEPKPGFDGKESRSGNDEDSKCEPADSEEKMDTTSSTGNEDDKKEEIKDGAAVSSEDQKPKVNGEVEKMETEVAERSDNRDSASSSSDTKPSVEGQESLLAKENSASNDKASDEKSAGNEKSDSGQDMTEGSSEKRSEGPTVSMLGMDKLEGEERHKLRHRELFLSRQIETLPATHIRSKCTVTLLNEMETPESYLNKDDVFFYSLVYDPTQKTLLADKGEIRVGEKFQSDIPEALLSEGEKENYREGENMETLVFHPRHSLTDRDIDQFLIVARAVGTFSRALDTSSSVKLPSLHMTAAAASRDVTLFHAMALLHHANYDLGLAMKYLVPPPSKQHYPLESDKTTGHHTVSLGGPILCRDQMEEWSAAEANLFEEALEKYGKDFNDIRQDFLPWKALKDIVEYYYMWKTTDRYVQQKRVKAMEAESRLKQVYIPNYNKPNPNLVGPNHPTGQPIVGQKPCESCLIEISTQWYAWGPPTLQLRLCGDCWSYWKKYGGLKKTHEFENYDKSGVSRSETGNAANGAPMAVQSQRPGGMPGIMPNPPSSHAHPPIGGRHVNPPVATVRPGTHLPPQNIPGFPMRAGMPYNGNMPGGPKTRAAFYLHTTMLTRIARRLAPKGMLNPRRAARSPFMPINMLALKQHCQSRPEQALIQALRTIRGGKGNITLPPGATQTQKQQQQEVIAAAKQQLQAPPQLTSHKRPAPSGSLVVQNGEAPHKKPRTRVPVGHGSPGKSYGTWTATNEDAAFAADIDTKTMRKSMSPQQLRHIARTPCVKNPSIDKRLTATNPAPPVSNGPAVKDTELPKVDGALSDPPVLTVE